MLNYKIAAADGELGAYVTGTSDEPRPGIVLLQEIFGVNNAMRLAADQFAADGFIVLVPDLFHQVRPGIELGYSEEEKNQAVSIWQSLDDGRVRRDVKAAVTALRSDPDCSGDVAIVGFCLGGKYALLAASDGFIDAAVSFYPVQVRDYQDRLVTLKCPTQIQLGDDDAHIPDEVHAILKKSTEGSPQHEYRLHPGAGHGFYNSIRAFGYHPEAAAKAHKQAVAFIGAALSRNAGTA